MDMNVVLSLLQQLGIVSLGASLVGAVGTWIVQKIKLQTLNIKGDTWEQTKLTIQVAVQATEQQLKDAGSAEKKAYCMGLSKKLLDSKGIKFDSDLLSTLVESQVWDKVNSPNASGITSTTVTTPTAGTCFYKYNYSNRFYYNYNRNSIQI